MLDYRSAQACCGRCGGTVDADRIARRRAYKSAVFSPPAAHRAVPQRPGPARPEPAAPTAAADLPRAVTGTVLDISPQILLLADADADGERRIALTSGATAWRGGPAEPTALRPGDQVVVRLPPGRRDVADKIWAGIGRVTGTIVEQEAGSLVVDEGTTRRRQVVVISPRAASRIQVRFPQLVPGHLIDVIGLRRGTVLEAFIPATAQPTHHVGKANPARAMMTSKTSFSGSAVWHEPAGDGLGVCYPAIDPSSGCPEAGPADGAGCVTMPYLAVGSMLHVRNDCAGWSRVLPVTGCSGIARLFCDRCLACGTSPRGRIADLAMASFVELGGDLERGCFNATIAIGW